MNPVATSWLVYGETGIHWGAALGVFAVSLLSVRWLRNGRRSSGVAARLIPGVWCALLFVAAWLLWQPVLVRTQFWEHDEQVLVLVDPSASMQRPLAGGDPSRRLDVAALWTPEPLSSRPTAPTQLQRQLDRLRPRLLDTLQQLERVAGEVAQGIPPGADLDAALAAYGSLSAIIGADVAPLATAAVEHAAAPGAVPAESLTHLNALAASATQLPPRPDSTGRGVAQATAALGRFAAAAAVAHPDIAPLQRTLDAAYLEDAGARLKPFLDSAGRHTRSDLAAHICAQAGLTPLPTITAAPERETNLYGHVAQALAAAARHPDGAPVSAVVLLSDGGQNTDGTADAAADALRRQDIDLITVGVGLPAAPRDLAIVDWQVPRIARSRRPVTARLTLKVPPATDVVRLRAATGGNELAVATIPCAGDPAPTVRLSFKAPKSGRHAITFSIVDANDETPENDAITTILDTSLRTPKVLIIGRRPDWDSAYLYLAARRAGCDVRQVFHDETDEPTPRGTADNAVPRTARQWGKYAVVMLCGAPFYGYAREDADALHAFAQAGGSLIVVGRKYAEYNLFPPFASADDSWPATAAEWNDGLLHLATESGHMPLLRLGIDAPQSSRLIRRCAIPTPPDTPAMPHAHWPLLVGVGNSPPCAISFHGRGRLYRWGVADMARWRGYSRSPHVDRLLTQLLADAAAPLFAKGQPLAAYPLPAVSGRSLALLSAAPDAPATVMVDGKPVALGNGIARVTVDTTATTLELAGGDAVITLPVVRERGAEELFSRFRPDVLRAFADAAGGRYLPAEEAAAALKQLQPRRYRSSTADRYPLADHWALLLLAAGMGGLCWVLRKLAGMAI
jgi:hypothetical protein